MNPQNIELGSLTAFVLTFMGGLVTGFNPCCYTMVPALVGYLGGYCEPTMKRCAWLSGWFAIELATATAILGLIAVLAGGIFGGVHPAVRYLLAVIPIVMGLHLLGIITIQVPGIRHWRPIRTGTVGAFLTCLFFSLAILPCATPILASILSHTASRGSVLYGSGLLFTYGVGIGLPLVSVGTGADLLLSLRFLTRWWSVVHRLSGVILIGLGFYLLWQA
ncbi:MAG: cytochrome c biogenesis protein CcdA [Acidobacteriota bacterium]|nr:cytochrome c biogenesis protein CcdA [Blastocatellia bacterium]MDW8239747.1 cytochrome c biogenesis protein CcdA [Acidobacteriota bacterium]